jgi:hypothetical protein
MTKKRKSVPYELPDGRLWPNTPSGSKFEIEVFGATGGFGAGKTILALSIAPGSHPEGHEFAGKPRTLLGDFEKSGGTYGGTGCHRIDVPGEMQRRFTDPATGKIRPYRPIDVFEWFLDLIDHVQPGQFDVIVADPITDLENGLAAYVKKNCTNFGMTPNQATKAGGLFWGAVKDYWKQVLLKLSSRCQTFFFTSHLRSVWQGERPVPGRYEPKGKDTLMELASLYLWLERGAGDNGNTQAVPSGIVIKERLAETRLNEQGQLEVVQFLPPRLPEATADAIREYIARGGVDYAKLRDDEQLVEKPLSEADMLALRESTAIAEREATEGQLALANRQAELRAAMEASTTAKVASDGPAVVTMPSQTAETVVTTPTATTQLQVEDNPNMDPALAVINRDVEAHAKAEIDEPPPQTVLTGEQAKELRELVDAVFPGCRTTKANKLKAILARVNCEKVSDLSKQQAARIIDRLKEEWLKRGN